MQHGKEHQATLCHRQCRLQVLTAQFTAMTCLPNVNPGALCTCCSHYAHAQLMPTCLNSAAEFIFLTTKCSSTIFFLVCCIMRSSMVNRVTSLPSHRIYATLTCTTVTFECELQAGSLSALLPMHAIAREMHMRMQCTLDSRL